MTFENVFRWGLFGGVHHNIGFEGAEYLVYLYYFFIFFLFLGAVTLSTCGCVVIRCVVITSIFLVEEKNPPMIATDLRC
jgi:hypothetical protein